MIYCFQSIHGGSIKIGFSNNIERRRAELESHYGQPLALLAVMEGGRDEERSIHLRFDHLRIGRSEQFRPAPELMAFIGRPLLVDPNPDAVEVMSGPPRYTKPIRLDLSPEIHQMLRVVAAENGKPMAVFARDLIEETVRKLYAERR
jgi:hypothetical protein